MANNPPLAEETSLEKAQPRDLLSVIANAVADPRMDVAKMRELFALQQDILAEERKIAFFAALSRVQAKLPPIDKDGKIVVKGIERSRYSKYETIDRTIKPFLVEEGFALSFDTESTDGKLFRISCKLSHFQGHSETKCLMLPMDVSDYRSNVQSIGSTVSYGRRQLVKMHLNLIESDEDDDGNGGVEPISDNDVLELNTALQDTKSNVGGFLKFMGVEDMRHILKRDLKKAFNAINEKRRQK